MSKGNLTTTSAPVSTSVNASNLALGQSSVTNLRSDLDPKTLRVGSEAQDAVDGIRAKQEFESSPAFVAGTFLRGVFDYVTGKKSEVSSRNKKVTPEVLYDDDTVVVTDDLTDDSVQSSSKPSAEPTFKPTAQPSPTSEAIFPVGTTMTVTEFQSYVTQIRNATQSGITDLSRLKNVEIQGALEGLNLDRTNYFSLFNADGKTFTNCSFVGCFISRGDGVTFSACNLTEVQIVDGNFNNLALPGSTFVNVEASGAIFNGLTDNSLTDYSGSRFKFATVIVSSELQGQNFNWADVTYKGPVSVPTLNPVHSPTQKPIAPTPAPTYEAPTFAPIAPLTNRPTPQITDSPITPTKAPYRTDDDATSTPTTSKPTGYPSSWPTVAPSRKVAPTGLPTYVSQDDWFVTNPPSSQPSSAPSRVTQAPATDFPTNVDVTLIPTRGPTSAPVVQGGTLPPTAKPQTAQPSSKPTSKDDGSGSKNNDDLTGGLFVAGAAVVLGGGILAAREYRKRRAAAARVLSYGAINEEGLNEGSEADELDIGLELRETFRKRDVDVSEESPEAKRKFDKEVEEGNKAFEERVADSHEALGATEKILEDWRKERQSKYPDVTSFPHLEASQTDYKAKAEADKVPAAEVEVTSGLPVQEKDKELEK